MEEPNKPPAGDRDDGPDLPIAQQTLLQMTLSPSKREKGGNAIEGLSQAIGEYKMSLSTWSVPVLAISGLAICIFVLAFWLNLVTGLAEDAGADELERAGPRAAVPDA